MGLVLARCLRCFGFQWSDEVDDSLSESDSLSDSCSDTDSSLSNSLLENDSSSDSNISEDETDENPTMPIEPLTRSSGCSFTSMWLVPYFFLALHCEANVVFTVQLYYPHFRELIQNLCSKQGRNFYERCIRIMLHYNVIREEDEILSTEQMAIRFTQSLAAVMTMNTSGLVCHFPLSLVA